MLPTTFQELITSQGFERLGWMLLHSIWQIALIGSIFWGVRASIRQIRPKRANLIYSFGCICLTAMVATPLTTLYLVTPATPIALKSEQAQPQETPTIFDEVAEESAFSWETVGQEPDVSPTQWPLLQTEANQYTEPRLIPSGNRILPPVSILALFWLAGMAIFSIRPMLGLWNVRRLAMSRMELPKHVQELVRQVIRQLNLGKTIEFAGSCLAQVPTVIGYFQPIVLIPAASVSGLTPLQIKQILAHEIAHIQRHDYLVNFVQTLLETLLFYHPVAWWVSNQVRIERENCCDDMAISTFGNSKSFVQALVAMEQTRNAVAPPALASQGGSLITRVRRLLDQPAPKSARRGRSAGACLSAILLVGIATTISLAAQPEKADPSDLNGLSNETGFASPRLALSESREHENQADEIDDQIIAMVNGQRVLRSTVEARCYHRMGKSVLESMINAQLVEDACRSQGITVSDESVQHFIEQKAERFGMSADKFLELTVKHRARTEAQMREQLKMELALRRLSAKSNGSLEDPNREDNKTLQQLFSQLRKDADVQVFDFKAFSYGEFDLDDTVAKVNGQAIQKRKVIQEAYARHARTLLQAEIKQIVLRQALSREGIEVTDWDIQKECLKAAKLHVSSKRQKGLDSESLIDQWLDEIKQQHDGSAEAFIQNQVWPMAALRKLVNHDGPRTITNADLRKAFAKHYGPRAEVLAIVTDDQKTAIKCWNLARANPTKSYFAELAKQYSVEPITQKSGGACPPIARSGTQPELEKTAFELEQGEISKVIHEVNGKWVILYRLGLTQPLADFDSVRDSLIARVQEDQLSKAMFFKLQALLGAADTQRFRLNDANLVRTSVQDPVPVEPKKEDEQILITYAIGDLIAPLPFVSNDERDEDEDEDEEEEEEEEEGVDATELIELIKKTISPDYWENDGGGIDFFQANASLIVHAKRSIHVQVQDLLVKLRELNEVTLEIRGYIVVMPKNTFTKHARNIPEESGTISYREAVHLFGLAKSYEDSTTYEIPVIDFLNGQSKTKGIADLDLGIDATISVQQTIGFDRKSVRTFVVAKDRNAKAPTGIVVPDVKHGEYVAVDVKGLLPESISDHKAVMVFRVGIFDNRKLDNAKADADK